MTKSIFSCLLLAASLALFSGTGCSRGDEAEAQSAGSNSAASQTSEANKANSASDAKDSEAPPKNVRVLGLQTGELTEYLVVSGALQPARAADVAAEESGVVTRILREKGAYVKRGEPVVALDSRILAAQSTAAEAAETLRRFNEERTQKLFDENSVSGQEMLIVHTEHEQAKAEAAIAKVRLEKASFPAPFAGIVADRYVEVGEYVNPGAPVMRIIDPYRLELHGTLTEREVSYISTGAAVRVHLEGLGQHVDGEVTWVGFEADEMTGKIPLEISVENRDLSLRAGLLGRARVEKQAHTDVLAIPRDAVLPTPDGPVVFVAEKGRARQRKVELGFDQGLLVEVRRGVEAGDELIVRGHRDLVDGSRIDIKERTSNRDGSLKSDPDEVRARDYSRDTTTETGKGL